MQPLPELPHSTRCGTAAHDPVTLLRWWVSAVWGTSELFLNSLDRQLSPLFAMVGFNVRDQRILGHVLFFMGKVEQQIETGKLRIAVD
jgi:hypothetical protein